MADVVNIEVERMLRKIVSEPMEGMIIIRINEDKEPYSSSTYDDKDTIEYLKMALEDYESNLTQEISFTLE